MQASVEKPDKQIPERKGAPCGDGDDGVRVNLEPIGEEVGSESSEDAAAEKASVDAAGGEEVIKTEEADLDFLVELGDRYPRIASIMDSVVARLRRRVEKERDLRRETRSVALQNLREQFQPTESTQDSHSSVASSVVEGTPRPLAAQSSNDETPPQQKWSYGKWRKRPREVAGLGGLSAERSADKFAAGGGGGFSPTELFSPIRFWRRRKLAGAAGEGDANDTSRTNTVWTWVLKDGRHDAIDYKSDFANERPSAAEEPSSEHASSDERSFEGSQSDCTDAETDHESVREDEQEDEQEETADGSESASSTSDESAYGNNMYLPRNLNQAESSTSVGGGQGLLQTFVRYPVRSALSWWELPCPTRKAEGISSFFARI